MDVKAGIDFLAAGGLNLTAIFDCAALPAPIIDMMVTSGVPVAEYGRLVLTAHGGQQLWHSLQAWGMKTADPVDTYSTLLTEQFIRDYLDDAETFWLYPNREYLVPLSQLGELAGWCSRSPLGLGISPTYGVWFAYRTAFLCKEPLPLVQAVPQPSLCDSCVEKPCITACPVGAVSVNGFDVEGCSRHRLVPGSGCGDRCLARLACPYLPEHRYSMAQVAYHYGRSLETLQLWYGE